MPQLMPGIIVDTEIAHGLFGQRWTDDTPCYSASISGAMQVIEELQRRGCVVGIQFRPATDTEGANVICEMRESLHAITVSFAAEYITPLEQQRPHDDGQFESDLNRAVARAVVQVACKYLGSQVIAERKRHA